MKNFITSLSRHFALPSAWVIAGFAGLFAGAVVHAQSPESAVVGEVTLNIGQAVIVSPVGESQAIQRGTRIRSGDRIETAEGGHVHIRFVDGALISVRPTSRLVVENYHYNPLEVARSLVRFRLEKGITRAISGAAADGAKDRFRLNTPLVAIGVRGTDFVVSTQDGETFATVNQGAIVMAPFGAGCLQQSSGPCSSATAKLLSSDMGNMQVEFKTNLVQPELRMLNNIRPPNTLLAQVNTPANNSDLADNRHSSKQLVRATGDETVLIAGVQSVIRIADISTNIKPPTQAIEKTETTPVLIPIPILSLSAIGGVVKPPEPLEPTQLAWGRWSATALGIGDFSQLRTDARTNRAVTVGDDNFVLYRAENAVSLITQNLGSVGFALQQSFAQFAAPTGTILPASVVNGSLNIDFANRNFTTLLNLNSLPTGTVALQVTGFIRDDGIFFQRSTAQNVAGAAAFDGKSAGYFFDKAAAGGVLSGITLWSR